MINHFFIAGAQRSGTTYLYQVLDEHPEIEMNQPVRPEPKFFLKADSHLRVDEYLQSFFHGRGAKIRGDKSASYMEAPGVAERIARCFPDAKLLFTLRNPIERATSNYWYTVSNNLETKSMREAILNEQEQDRWYDRTAVSVSPYAYLRRGRYVDYIDVFARYFPKEQIRVHVFETFVGDLTAVQDLYEFLGVARDFVPPSLDERINESPNATSETSAEIEDFLRSYFREPNQQLADRYGVDVEIWNQCLQRVQAF